MKKIFALTVCASVLSAGIAFGTEMTASGAITGTDGLQIFGGIDATNSASTTASTLIGKLSKGVIAGANYSYQGYAMNTKHNNGSTAYGTAHDSTAIYKSEIGVATTLTAPSAADNTSFATWTAM